MSAGAESHDREDSGNHGMRSPKQEETTIGDYGQSSTETLNSTDCIKRGDHLIIKKWTGHPHHVLATGKITDPKKHIFEVIEYKHAGVLRTILKSNISVNTKKGSLLRVHSHVGLSGDDIERAITKAKKQIGFGAYTKQCENNCENFIYWCFADTIYNERISHMYVIKRGDHIIESIGPLDWHMLAVEDGAPNKPLQVIQYTEQVSSSAVTLHRGYRQVLRMVYPQNSFSDGIIDDHEISIRKAESQIGFKKYSSEKKGGEHFVNWCKTETGHRERVTAMSHVKRGDHLIYAGALSIDYHYLATENGHRGSNKIEVIEYKINKVVKTHEELDPSTGHLYRFVDDDSDLIQHNVDEVILQAERQIGEREYCSGANKNTHFVYWCKTRCQHRERIRNPTQLENGDHLVIRKYKGEKEYNALYVKPGVNDNPKIISYLQNLVTAESITAIDFTKTEIFRVYKDAFETTSQHLNKDRSALKALQAIRKEFYCVGANTNSHFVKWCMVNTEIVEKIDKVDDIQKDDWFYIQCNHDNSYKLYMATTRGRQNKIKALGISDADKPSTETDLKVDHSTEIILRVDRCFVENTTGERNAEYDISSGQSLYSGVFIRMSHILKPDPKLTKLVTNVRAIRKADHLMVMRKGGLYYHHYLASGDGSLDNTVKVIHFTKPPGDFCRKVHEATLTIDPKKEKYYLINHINCDDPETVLNRARQKIGQRGYSLEYNNCEHFVTECKLGSKQSQQLNFLFQQRLVSLREQCLNIPHHLSYDEKGKRIALVGADIASEKIVMRSMIKGRSNIAIGMRAVSAASGIAAAAAVVTESAFLTIDVLDVKRKENQVRLTSEEKRSLYTRKWQIGGGFVGGVVGTLGGAVAGSFISGLIGQTLIPVPGAGFLIGSVVGGVVGKVALTTASGSIGHSLYNPSGSDIYIDFLRMRRNSKRFVK